MSLRKRNFIIFTLCCFLYCFSQSELPDIYPQVITCCSIILGFTIASLTSFYNHHDINLILKEQKQLDAFLNYNQRFIITTIGVLALTLAVSLMKYRPYNFQILKLNLYFHMKALIFVATMHMLYQASEYIIRIIQLYRNTYSDIAQSKLSKLNNKKRD